LRVQLRAVVRALRFGSLGFVALAIACTSSPMADAGMDAPSDAGVDVGTDANIDSSIPYPMGDPLSWAVDQPGPFHVGYRNFPFSYLPAGQTTMRQSVLHIWYPTLASTGPHPRYGGLYTDANAYTNAPLAASPWTDHQFPLEVHSHGWQAFGGSSWNILDNFVSHGWVVAAPEHTGSLFSSYQDPRPIAHYYERGEDISTAIDLVRDLDANDPLHGLVHTDRVFMTGHSFGVHTVWSVTGATFDVPTIMSTFQPMGAYTQAELNVFAAGVADPRVIAAVPLCGNIDTNFFGTMGQDSVHVPLMLMTGTMDGVDGMAEQMHVAPPVHMSWVSITGACHNSFAVTGLCPMGAPDADVYHMANAYILSFARVQLLHDTDAIANGIVNGTHVVDTRATFTASP
jgi:predicted dienelactone hydrolase